jgi:hypothetical protein
VLEDINKKGKRKKKKVRVRSALQRLLSDICVYETHALKEAI